METAKLNAINPEAWLADILPRDDKIVFWKSLLG
ncbi:MAG: transposase domain-containing protein [Aquidulcibacter sp.]|nr:transposase domain-containing protein [Aquidulcibacter sp.]